MKTKDKKKKKIIHEDKNILVINKPAGLMVHSDGKTKEKTLVDWLVKKDPSIKKVGDEPELRPGIVHRLDRGTSGVLIIAKNQKTFEELKNQFQERSVKKIYEAIVWGWLKEERGTISASIGRSPKFGKFSAGRGKRGTIREAVTEYKVLKKFTDNKNNKWSHVEVYPKTGRTHQIRVHFNYINHPVACDALYGGEKCLPKINRLALHAATIEFVTGNKKMRFKAPLPPDFKKAL